MSFTYIKGKFYPVEIEGRGFTAVAITAPSNVADGRGRLCWRTSRTGIFKSLAELRADIEDCAAAEYFRTLRRTPAKRIARERFTVPAAYADEFLSAEGLALYTDSPLELYAAGRRYCGVKA